MRRSSVWVRICVGLLWLLGCCTGGVRSALAAAPAAPSDASGGSTTATMRDWLPPEVDARLQELSDVRDSPLALAPLLDLHRLQKWLTASQAQALLDKEASIVREPLARTWVQYAHLRLALALGDVDAVNALQKQMGFVEQWRVVGPFRNDGMNGFRTAYAPESDGYQGEDQRFVGKFDGLRWLPIQHSAETGYVAAGETIADASNAVLYGVSACYFERAPDHVELSVNGAYKLWVNGKPVAKAEKDLGGVLIRDRAPVRAKRGWNRIFLKVATEDVEPGWHMRFVDRRGRSVIRNCRLPNSAGGPVHQPKAFPKATTLADQFRERERASWGARERVNAAYILRVFQDADDAQPWNHFMGGLTHKDVAAIYKMRAARVEHAHWQKSQRIEGLDTDQASVAASLYALNLRAADVGLSARDTFVHGLSALLQRAKDDPRVLLADRQDAGQELGGQVVHGDLFALLARYGARPALCDAIRARVQFEDAEHRVEAALELCAQRSLGSLSAVKNYMRALAKMGDMKRVKAVREAYATLWSNRRGWFRIEQMIASFTSDWTAVLAAVDKEIQFAPNDADTYMRRARTLIRLSRYDDAAHALDKVLDLRPQQQSARDALHLLKAQKEQFFAKWRVDSKELRTLGKNADADGYNFSRLVHQRVTNVYPSGLATTYFQKAYAVNTREGAQRAAGTSIWYTPNAQVVQIVAVKVLSPDGTVRETFDSRDFRPYAGASGMYGDARRRTIAVSGLQPGDIVSYEYTRSDISYQNMFDNYFGDLWLIDGFRPTALARYVLYTPEDKPIYTEISGKKATMNTHTSAGRTMRKFEAHDIPAVENEHYAPGATQTLRYIHVSTYDDVDEMANWYWNLLKDQLVTSPEMIDTVHRLIEGKSSAWARVEAIYGYVVRKIRYVGLEFGIHGFKPYKTTVCFNRKYGDCKNTAALLKVMLNIAGIPSELVLLRTRDRGRINNRYPSLQLYNHEILYVPTLQLYLDGTATYNGMQETPGGDQGATALIIEDGKGGRVVTTPYLSAELNVFELWQTIDARDAEAKGTIRARYIGGHAPRMRSAYEGSEHKREKIERWAASLIPNIHAPSVQFEGLDDIEKPVEYTAKIRGGKWLQKRGDTHVLLPFGYTAYNLTRMTGISKRTQTLVLGPPSIKRIHLDILLPPVLTPRSIPEGKITIEDEEFGRYVMDVHWDAGAHRLTVDGFLRWNVAEVSPDEYPRFRAWARKIEHVANKAITFTDKAGNEVTDHE